tara:strand:+ start:2488 stop:3855 length:1368 start_codon:yes stop_codon:yes gene_type:complete
MIEDLSTIRQYGMQIREGKLRIKDAVQHYQKKINERNTELNIVVKSFEDEAQDKAEALEEELRQGKDRGPMHGVPIAVKDIFAMTGCVPAAGSGAEIRCSDEEAAVIRKLKASGAIILGTLNLDEFAAGGTGANFWFGRCKNPLDPRRITGGSSSGSAAAVSAGFCLASIGSDAGGSIRIPAAFCGVYGLKPTYGRVGRSGAVPRTWSMDCIGPLASSVDDLGIVLAAISGFDADDPTSRRDSDFIWTQQDHDNPPRIGFLSDKSGSHMPLAHYERALTSIEQSGLLLIPKSLDKLDLYTEYHQRVVKSEAATYHRAALRGQDSTVAPETVAALRSGMQVSAMDYLEAQTQRELLLQEFSGHVMDDVEVLVLPVSYEEAPIYHDDKFRDAEMINQEFARASIFTRFVNFLGLPAVSLPTGVGPSGLPTAVQLIAKPFEEATMLNIAAEMESVFSR